MAYNKRLEHINDMLYRLNIHFTALQPYLEAMRDMAKIVMQHINPRLEIKTPVTPHFRPSRNSNDLMKGVSSNRPTVARGDSNMN